MSIVDEAVPERKADRRQELVAELRRGEILAAAQQVFGANGFEATHMEEIARAAGLAKGTLYLYFASKEAIYEAAVLQALGELDRLMSEHLGREQHVAGKVAAFVRVRIAYWQEHQTLYRVILSLSREGKHRRQSIAFQRESVERLAALLAEGARAGEIPQQDFLAAAWTVMDAIRGVNERRAYDEGRSVPEDTAFLTAFLLQALGAQPAGHARD